MQGHCCHSIERCQKVLRTKCKNKCKIEASIAKAYILEEVSNFTTKYYADNLPSVHNPSSRYNADGDESSHSIFRGQLGSASGATHKFLKHEEWCIIMLYVLSHTCCKFSTNLFSSSRFSMSNSHVSCWYWEFHRQFWRKSRKPTPHESDTLLKEGAGNGKPDFISWFKQKV